MSKLVKHIGVERGGRLAIPSTISHMSVDDRWFQPPTRDEREYHIRATWEARAVVTETHNSGAYAEAVAAAKHAMIEEVFGEFRQHFRACDLALYERDWDGLRDALKHFEQQMFSDD